MLEAQDHSRHDTGINPPRGRGRSDLGRSGTPPLGNDTRRHLLDSVDGGSELAQHQLRLLVLAGLLPQVVLLDGPEARGREVPLGRAARIDKIQEKLLELLAGQLLVQQREGQPIADAMSNARTDLTRVLDALRSERQRHVAGPATEAAFRRFQDLFRQRALRTDRGLAVTLEEALTDAGFERFQRQENTFREASRRTREVQAQLISFIPAYVSLERRDGEQDGPYANRVRAEQEAKAREIQIEQEQGVWGPRSQAAYRQYQKWFHEDGMPAMMGLLDSLALRWPVGCPERLRMTSSERAENPELFRALLAAGRRIPRNTSDPALALEDAQYQALQRSNRWFRAASDATFRALLEPENEKIKQLIKSQNLPEGWLAGADTDPRRWHAAAGSIANLYAQAGNLLEAMDHLHRGSRGRSFPFVPPPGTEFLCRDGEYRRDPTANDIARNNDGTLRSFRLRRPDNVFLDDRATWETVQELRRWVDAHSNRVTDGVLTYRDGLAHPERLFSFTNLEIHGRHARINSRGELIGIAQPGQPITVPGETRRPFNLIEMRCEVKVATEGPNKGHEVIVQMADAYQIHTLGYQNWIGTRVASIPQREVRLDRTQFYGVLNGNKIELVRGDRLASVLSSQCRWLRAEQIITPALDGALAALTLGEGFAAVSAARATGAGARLTGAELARESARLGLQVTMVGAGIGNSAGGRETEFGRFVHHARGAYFLCDIARGIGQGTGVIPRAAYAAKMENALAASPWLKSWDKTTSRAFRGLECCLVPFIARDFGRLGATALGSDRRNLLDDASVILGDGVNLRRPDRESFNMRNPGNLRREGEIIDRYSGILQEGRDERTRTEVGRILARTKELLSPDVKASDREAFKQEMLAYFVLEPSKMAELKRRLNLTERDLREFHDPNLLASKWTENGVAAEVRRRHQAVGPDIRVAAAIALLAIARQPDGTIPSELVSMTTRHLDVTPRRPRSTQYTVGLSFHELVGYLNRDLALPDQRGRDVLVGEVLVRHGAMTGQQYAGTLLRNLADVEGPARNRMAALTDPIFPRLATIIDGLRGAESAEISSDRPWQGFGVTANNLMDALRRTARTDPNQDVRSMAAMLLFGLNHPDRQAGQAILQANNARWQVMSTRAAGTYAAEVRQYLERQTRSELPAAAARGADAAVVREANQRIDQACAARLNATLQLWELSDKRNNNEQRNIARLVASCWSDSSAEVSVKVLDALTPDRMRLLSDAQMAELRTKAVALLSVPEVTRSGAPGSPTIIGPELQEQAAAMIQLIRRIPQLLGNNNPELTRNFCTKLEQMIDPRAPRSPDLGDRTYGNLRNQFKPTGALPAAALFPELMSEAIRALAQHGSQSSIPLIRARLSGEPPVFETNQGPRPFVPQRGDAALNADPSVMLEAARALAFLRDDRLRDMLPPLVRTQLDPAVAQTLRDIQADFPPRNPPDREEARRLVLEQARLDYLGPQLPNEEAGKRYLKSDQYSLLNSVNYRSAVEVAAASIPRASRAAWVIGAYEAYNARMDSMRAEEVSKRLRDRNTQWNALVAMAGRSDRATRDEAGKAKAALSWILLHNAHAADFSISPPDDGRPGVAGAGLLSGDSKTWVLRAARSLVDVLINGEDKPKTAHIIAQALRNDSVDPEAKLILVRGLRWMYEQSNRLVSELGPGAGASRQHRELLGFHRQGLAKIVDDTLAAERRKALGASGPERGYRERLRTELLTEFGRFAGRGEVSEVLLASALHDPSQSIKDLAWQKFYEKRDGIEPLWQVLPTNRNANLEDAISRVTAAHGPWRRERDGWMRYLADFRRFVNDPRRDGENPPLVPAAGDRRDALVHAILSGFKDCRFDGRNGVAEAQALELLSTLMDDPDGKVRLAASKVLMESSVPIHDMAKCKAIKTCLEFIAQDDNPQYKLDAAAQLARVSLPLPARAFIEGLNNLTVPHLREVLAMLDGLSRHHPSREEKTKAAQILGQFWPQYVEKILTGNVQIDPDELRANDPLIARLLASIKNSRLPEEQRLRAAEIWLRVDHKALVRSEDFDAAVNVVKNMALNSTTPRIKDSAARLLSDSLRISVERTPAELQPGWAASRERQRLLVRAVAEVRHPGGVEILDRVARDGLREGTLTGFAARDSLVDMTLSDITRGLTEQPDGRIPFRPLVASDDPRMRQFGYNIVIRDNEQAKLASIYAFLSPESTGVSDYDRQAAIRQLVRLTTDGAPNIQRQARWILGHLDKRTASAVVPALLRHFDQLAHRTDEEGRERPPNRAKMELCLQAVVEVFRNRLADAESLPLLIRAVDRGSEHLSSINATTRDLAGILVQSIATLPETNRDQFLLQALQTLQYRLLRDDPHLQNIINLTMRSLTTSQGLAENLLGNREENIALAAALTLTNGHMRPREEACQNAFARLADLSFNGSHEVRRRANARFRELERTNPAECLTALWSVERRLIRDEDVEACRARMAELRRIIDETYLPADRLRDSQAEQSKDPEVNYSRLALKHQLELLEEQKRLHGAESVEVGRVRLALAKIYFARSQHYYDREEGQRATRMAEHNARLAENILRKHLGNDSVEVADACYRLGLLYLRADYPGTADRHFREAAAIYSRAGADRHAANLAWIDSRRYLCNLNLGNNEAAQACQQQMINRIRSLDHAAGAEIRESLERAATTYWTGRHYARAESVLRSLLTISDGSVGVRNTGAPQLVLDLACLLGDQGKHEEALPHFVNAIRYYQRNERRYREQLMQAFNLYGHSLSELGRDAEAQRVWDRADQLDRELRAQPRR